jgi:hypothetical protein
LQRKRKTPCDLTDYDALSEKRLRRLFFTGFTVVAAATTVKPGQCDDQTKKLEK